MTGQDARTLAVRLMAEHGLQDWTFAFDRARTRCGQCRFRDRAITLSAHYVGRNPADMVENTIRHEIAHALVGPGHGHDVTWRLMAARIGARPERCNARADMPERTRHALRCKACGYVWRQHRITARVVRQIMAGNRWHVKCGRLNGKLEVV